MSRWLAQSQVPRSRAVSAPCFSTLSINEHAPQQGARRYSRLAPWHPRLPATRRPDCCRAPGVPEASTCSRCPLQIGSARAGDALRRQFGNRMRPQFGRATASGILEDSTLKKDAARRGKRAGNSVNRYTPERPWLSRLKVPFLEHFSISANLRFLRFDRQKLHIHRVSKSHPQAQILRYTISRKRRPKKSNEAFRHNHRNRVYSLHK